MDGFRCSSCRLSVPAFFARTEEVGGNVKASKYVNYNE